MVMAATSEKEPERSMVDRTWVSRRLACSQRHVDRLRDGRLMPPPMKLGSLIRWERSVIEAWIAEGCPAVR